MAEPPQMLYYYVNIAHMYLSVFVFAVQRQQGYASLQDEAVRVFNSLQEMETLADTVPIIQGILQTCQDLRPLRDEVLKCEAY